MWPRWAKKLLPASAQAKPKVSVQYVQDGAPKDVSAIHPWGFFSQMPNGEYGLLLPLHGSYDTLAFFEIGGAIDPNAKDDVVQVGHPTAGTLLKFGADGSIRIYSAKGANIKVEIDGDLQVKGTIAAKDVNASDDVKAGNISLKSHTHGGVQPGGGTTGQPQ